MSLSIHEMRDLLNDVFDTIVHKAKPEDVFSEDELKAWAREQDLEDVFDTDDLESWALKNGFIKDES